MWFFGLFVYFRWIQMWKCCWDFLVANRWKCWNWITSTKETRLWNVYDSRSFFLSNLSEIYSSEMLGTVRLFYHFLKFADSMSMALFRFFSFLFFSLSSFSVLFRWIDAHSLNGQKCFISKYIDRISLVYIIDIDLYSNDFSIWYSW